MKNFAQLLIIPVILLSSCAGEEEPVVTADAPDPVRVVFLGDSITEAGANPGGYVAQVADSLQATYGQERVQVIGAGISGNKVPDLLERLQADVLDHEPTHVVIYIGINDVWHSYEFDHVTGTDSTAFRSGLQDLIGRIEGRGAAVLLCTPSVIGEDPDSSEPVNQHLMRFADISRSVVAETGVRLCDLRQEFESYLRENNPDQAYEGILTTDGVHLNEAGNGFVASFMLRHLREVLGDSERTLTLGS